MKHARQPITPGAIGWLAFALSHGYAAVAGSEIGLATITPLDGTATTPQPYRLAGDELLAYLARSHGTRPLGPEGVVGAHYFTPDGHERPGKTQGCTAVSA
jgi:hypothetical protein